MSEPKTVPTGQSVAEFLDAAEPAGRREDGFVLRDLFDRVTGTDAVMWGPSMVGYGLHHYRYETGREGDTPAISFSPRKGQTVLYLSGTMEQYQDLLDRLGPHKTGKACLYLKRVDQADAGALREIVSRSFRVGSER